MDVNGRALAFAVLLEHLESEGMHMAKSIVEDEYSSRFGDQAIPALRAAMGKKLAQLCPSENGALGMKSSSLVRLLATQNPMSTRVRVMDSISKAADDAHDALQTRKPVLVSSPVRIDLVAPVRMPVATASMHTKNTSRARACVFAHGCRCMYITDSNM